METTLQDRLFNLLKPDHLTAVVDIGANPIDGNPPYKAMLDQGLCRVIGFEPQEKALARLNRNKGPLETYLPYAVGGGNEHTLHICRAPGMTSILKPDARMLDQFHLFTTFGEIVDTTTITTHKLDHIEEIEVLDFLKIDVQGAELSVFRGGEAKLAEAVAIQTEVSFLPLYENQPLFGDIDRELRTQGFIPHTFAALKQWAITPLVHDNDPRRALNQILEADMVYVRDFTQPQLMSDEQLKHLSLVAHHCYGSYDLTLRCVLNLEKRGCLENDASEQYLQLLNRVKQGL